MNLFDPNDIPQLVKAQKAFFNTDKTRSIAFRKQQLKLFLEALKKNEKEMLDALKADLNKSHAEGFLTEVSNVINETKLAIKNLKKWASPQSVGTPITHKAAKSYRMPEPYGTTLIVSPWNYPILLTFEPLIGAIAAGNTVIIKPSEVAPASSAVMHKIISDTFDTECIAVVEGGIDLAKALMNERFDYLFYTGSTQIGKLYYEVAARNLTPVTLELGGKSPCIVGESANIQESAKRIVWGKCLNSGQSCTAPDYILVHSKSKKALIEALKTEIENAYGKDPQSSDNFPRIINQRHFDRIVQLMDESKVIYGGTTDRDDCYIAPTLLDNVTLQDKVMQEEIFGPLLPIIEFKNVGKVVEIIRTMEKPLALYIFSTKDSFTQTILTKTSAGGVCINDTMLHMTTPDLPFGGVGHSGIGGYHGKFSFDTFSHYKSVMKRSLLIDATKLLRFAPWTDSKFNLMKRIL